MKFLNFIYFCPRRFFSSKQTVLTPVSSRSSLFACLMVSRCRLLITFSNNLDPDQDLHNVGPDLDPNRLTL